MGKCDLVLTTALAKHAVWMTVASTRVGVYVENVLRQLPNRRKLYYLGREAEHESAEVPCAFCVQVGLAYYHVTYLKSDLVYALSCARIGYPARDPVVL